MIRFSALPRAAKFYEAPWVYDIKLAGKKQCLNRDLARDPFRNPDSRNIHA